jgi:hypothetical protein
MFGCTYFWDGVSLVLTVFTGIILRLVCCCFVLEQNFASVDKRPTEAAARGVGHSTWPVNGRNPGRLEEAS